MNVDDMRRWGIVAAVIATTACVGCDRSEARALEARLRQDSSRPGKVGTLRALQVRHSAGAVARAVARGPRSDCDTTPAHGPIRYTFELALRRTRRGARDSEWKETRVFRRSGDDVSVSSDATFQTAIGLRGTRRRALVIAGDVAYLSDDGVWWSRPADGALRRRAREAGPGTLQGLLDVVTPGWKAAGPGVFGRGSSPLRCEETSPGSGFATRFLAEATLREARLTVEPKRRSYRTRWELSDAGTLTVAFDDRVEPLDHPPQRPPKDQVVAAGPDRSMATAQKLLERMDHEGWIALDEAHPDEAK